jgi:hypothetical protein
LRVLPIAGVSLYASGMAMLILATAPSGSLGSGEILAALAFLAVSLLGGAVTTVIRAQDRRIEELERRVRDHQGRDAETGAAPDPARDPGSGSS